MLRARSKRTSSSRFGAMGPTPTAEAAEPTADSAGPTPQDAFLLQKFSLIPNIDKAWLLGHEGSLAVDILVSKSQRNLPANAMRKFLSSARLDTPDGTPIWAPFPWELTGVAAVVPSPSGRKVLVVRNGTAGKDGGGAIASATKLEIWSSQQLVAEIQVAASVHGPLYTDGWFEGISWSPDETRIAYVCEETAPKAVTWGKRIGSGVNSALSDESGSSGGTEEAGTWKGRRRWEDDWGEKYGGKGRPVVFVADVASGAVRPVAGIPSDLSAGQVIWAPPTSSAPSGALVFVGWSHSAANFKGTPRKLGMIYCFNRPCSLYAAAAAPPFPGSPLPQADGRPVLLTPDITSAFSPRFSPDGSTLAFLSAAAAVDSGAHNATNSLHSAAWPKDTPLSAITALKIRTVVGVLPAPDKRSGCPGLYCTSLPGQPFVGDEGGQKQLVLGTQWRSDAVVAVVDLESGSVTNVNPPTGGPASYVLLDVQYGLALAASSSPVRTAQLMVARIGDWDWRPLTAAPPELDHEVEAGLASLSCELLQVDVPNVARALPAGGEYEPFEAILICRRAPDSASAASDAAKDPLVVVPHGGPHGATPTSFIMAYAYLAVCGFNVLHVNYRGSTGFGEEALQSLPGNIGRQDVGDVLAALDATLKLGVADPAKVAVNGGSHGGFLAGHLIGQAPDRFRTAILRNPVCNLSNMVGISDIPDWCFIEAFGPAGAGKYSEAPSADDLNSLFQVSPMAHVDKVKVPTLFMLGEQDRRVPVSNGLQYVHALRARGLRAEVIAFPEDVHAIDKPQSEFDNWVNAVAWLREHLG